MRKNELLDTDIADVNKPYTTYDCECQAFWLVGVLNPVTKTNPQRLYSQWV